MSLQAERELMFGCLSPVGPTGASRGVHYGVTAERWNVSDNRRLGAFGAALKRTFGTDEIEYM